MKETITTIFPCRAMDRRAFLRLSGLLGLGVAATAIVPARAEAVMFNHRLRKVSKTSLAMGTVVSMTLFHASRDRAEEAMGLAFKEMDRLARLMSRYDESTAVAQLNKEGHLHGLTPELARVLQSALHYNRISGGCFDITVKPVVDLFRDKLGQGKEKTVSEKDLNRVLGLVDSGRIRLQNGSVSFQRPGMGITLDGIAKGYIVDRASAILAECGVTDHLINAGGDIRTMGSKPDEKPWTVVIQDPEKKENYPDMIQMRNGAVATSGNYEVYFDREKMFHHIVDPRTGLSPDLATSVSVLAQNTMEADALSTSVFVMGSEPGVRFIESLSGCECLIIARDGSQQKSRGWKSAAI
ncbi:MAG: FAD:protein FMN transferase [Deltaproteobacteria bacterium]|nr:FAD:protein FMN transferase [Deltaproteobacteria bacterium]